MTYADFFPEVSKNALCLLKKAGFEAYFVGGCVRDFYMSRKAYDFDLTTNAPSQSIIDVLSKGGFDARLIGGDCGTVGAKKDGLMLEITPYRTEYDYKDHRHPEKVEFVDNIKSDLARRDFTINSLALCIYDNKTELVDLFGGMDDIKNKIIRCVGDPEKRFEEDALRILRALRFSTRFGFEIEPETARVMTEKRHLLKYISAERKFKELSEILENPEISGVLNRFSDVFSEIVGSFVEKGADSVPQSFCERFFFILRKRDQNEFLSLLKELKADRKSAEKIISYKRIFDALKNGISTPFEMISDYGYLCAGYFKIFGEYEKYKDIFENPDIPKTVSELKINGTELKEMGFSGREIRDNLKKLLLLCIKGELENKKDALTLYLKNNY